MPLYLLQNAECLSADDQQLVRPLAERLFGVCRGQVLLALAQANALAGGAVEQVGPLILGQVPLFNSIPASVQENQVVGGPRAEKAEVRDPERPLQDLGLGLDYQFLEGSRARFIIPHNISKELD